MTVFAVWVNDRACGYDVSLHLSREGAEKALAQAMSEFEKEDMEAHLIVEECRKEHGWEPEPDNRHKRFEFKDGAWVSDRGIYSFGISEREVLP